MANGTLAASQLEMLSQSGTGIMTIVPPATNTNRTLTLPDSTGTVATLGTSLTLATAVASTSGTSIDFTGIPSWVKRITVMFNGVSLSGTSNLLVQLGDAGGVETTDYLGACNTFNTTPSALNNSSGFLVTEGAGDATWLIHGLMVITNVSGNVWVASHSVGITGIAAVSIGGGSKTLSDTLTQVRITAVNGTDTFDAGTINIMYE